MIMRQFTKERDEDSLCEKVFTIQSFECKAIFVFTQSDKKIFGRLTVHRVTIFQLFSNCSSGQEVR